MSESQCNTIYLSFGIQFNNWHFLIRNYCHLVHSFQTNIKFISFPFSSTRRLSFQNQFKSTPIILISSAFYCQRNSPIQSQDKFPIPVFIQRARVEKVFLKNAVLINYLDYFEAAVSEPAYSEIANDNILPP